MREQRRPLRAAPAAPVPNALMASARVLSAERIPIRAGERWQDEAWARYEDVGELRYAVTYVANGLSRCKLVAALPGTPANPTPQPIDDPDDPAVQAVARLAGGSVGQAGMLAAFGVCLTVPGIAYLVGEVTPDGAETWNVYAPDVIKAESGVYKLQDDDSHWRELSPDALVVQVWRPDRRRPWAPDSPVRGVLPVLRELQLLNERIIADATSRLAGAGLLLVASEIEFPPVTRADGTVLSATESFTEALMEMMMRPIGDRESAAAVVPFPVRIPGEWIDKVKHLSFATPFDARLLEHREAAITRLAVGLDLPREAVLGLGDVNHWSAWQISDEAVDLHIDPLMETVCEGLTAGYLAPALAAADQEPTGAVVWYDDGDLRTPADQSGKAVEMYDRGELSSEAMRRESGFTDADRPTIPQLRQQILIHTMLTAPDQLAAVAAVLPSLSENGLIGPLPALPAPAQGPAGQGDGPAETPTPSPRNPPGGPPPRPAGPPSPAPAPPPPVAASGLPDGLLEGCHGLVVRALERAGNKLRRSAGLNGREDGCPPELAHTCVPDAVMAAADHNALLAGAWEGVPELAARYGQDPVALRRFLNGYAKSLLATGAPHSYATLAGACGYVSS